MIVVAACFRLETAWIPKIPGTRVVRVRVGAPSGFARAITAGGRPDLLISTGFCGGLDPRLGIGDLILATEVIHRGQAIAIAPELLTRARAALAREGIHPAPGRLVTAARVIGKKAEKERLEQRKRIEKMERESRRTAWITKAEVDFAPLPAKSDEIVDLIMKAEDSDSDMANQLVDLLKASAEIIKQSSFYDEKGTSEDFESSPEGKIEALAKSYLEQGLVKSLVAGKAKAWKEHPEYRREMREGE